MGDVWTIVLALAAALFAAGLGWVMGADYGYRRGWLMGERSAAKRTTRQIEFAEEQVRKMLARERATILRVYGEEESADERATV